MLVTRYATLFSYRLPAYSLRIALPFSVFNHNKKKPGANQGPGLFNQLIRGNLEPYNATQTLLVSR
jgi:hypothetical protein